MLAFAFSLSFVFDVYVGHCIFSLYYKYKKAKIIAEIDVIIKNNELTDFVDELLHSKKAKKKYEWYNMT